MSIELNMPLTAPWLLAIIFALASLLHGISGLGVTLVTTAVLASIFPLNHAIILAIFPSLILNALTWLWGGDYSVKKNFTYYLKNYWLLAVTSLLGSLLGVKLLLWVDNAYILILLSLVISFYVISHILGKKIVVPNTKPSLIATGLIAGIIGGSTNAMSTILIMYLLSITNNKHTIAKVGNMCYLLGKLAQLIVLREQIYQLPTSDWILIGILCLVSVIGVMIGIRFRHFLSPKSFRKLVMVILIVLGIKVGWQGIEGLLTPSLSLLNIR